MTDDNKRTIRLNVRLQPEMKEKLDSIADSMGVPSSTLGAVAIGEYVRQKVLQNQVLTDATVSLTQAINHMAESMISAEQQLDLLNDSEAEKQGLQS